MKSGQRSNIGSEKCHKQVTLYGQYQQVKARAKAEKLSSAGKLWEDADFKSLKMDEYCKDMVEALDAHARPMGMFRNWQENWERKPVGAYKTVKPKRHYWIWREGENVGNFGLKT
jgi:hypothetical protein